jgi:DNA-binding GntR family transcriptional regulator
MADVTKRAAVYMRKPGKATVTVDLDPIDPYRRTPTYRQIADQLIAAIRQGRYQPGDRLPSEAQLIGYYDVVRATVRRAFALIELSGLARHRHGAGAHEARAALAKVKAADGSADELDLAHIRLTAATLRDRYMLD